MTITTQSTTHLVRSATSQSPTINWSQLYHHRKSVQKKFPKIWDVPIKKRYHQVITERCQAIDSLLELGAGQRHLLPLLKKHYPAINYKSFDIDQTNKHDFYSLDAITGEYDVVCMFEVIEHISPTLALDTLTTAFAHLKPGGIIFVTTPNTFNPPEYLRDATHITPWCYDELGAIIQHAEFELEAIYRLYHDSVIKKLTKRFLLQFLFRLLGIDFSKQIVAIGRKP